MRFAYTIKRTGMIDIDPEEYKDLTDQDIDDASPQDLIDFIECYKGDPEEVWYGPYEVTEDIEYWEV